MKTKQTTREPVVHELSELRSQNAALKKSMTGSISAELAAEEARRYAESIVETVREPLLVLDSDLKIISANRSADLASAIAMEMGLPQDKIDGIRMAGSIHDIGKLSIPAEILSKPTKLSDIEFSLIKEHARKGFEMLKDVQST